MSNQVTLEVSQRTGTGKGAAGRIRRTGRVPAVLYGYEADPTPVAVDALELYHALHGPAGTNVLLRVALDGDDHLCVARDVQRHPVRGDVRHLDLVAVDRTSTISVEIPVHLTDEPDDLDGVLNQILFSVPIQVSPLDVPNELLLSTAGMVIGDVRRVEDLTLPAGAEFEIEPERTVVTVNAPDILEEPEEDEALEPELIGEEGEELPPPGEGPADPADVAATEEA